MKNMPRSSQLRRAAAFLIDSLGFALIAALVCRGIDHATYVDFPPHQAAKAAARIVPTLLFLYAAWVLLPMVLWQATLGKKLLGLTVLRDGRALSLTRLIVRELIAKPISLIMNGAGLIVGLVTGVAFHDQLVGSRVDDDSVDEPWPAVPPSAIAAVVAVTAFLFWSIQRNGLVYRVLWNGAFYVPHEAGHLIVGLVLPHLVGVAAGAWGQLLFPSIAAVVFAANRKPVQLSGALVWLAFSLFDIARYAADAWYREGALPVAVGDDFTEDNLESHDWWQLLSAARVLRYAQPIGEVIGAFGWLSVGLAVGLLVVLARKKR